MQPASPDAFALTSFAAIAAICATLRGGHPLTWDRLEPALRTAAAAFADNIARAGNPALQAEARALFDALLTDPPAIPEP